MEETNVNYLIKLVNDTLKKVINITTLGPIPAVSGPSVICRGEKYVYTASGGSTYLWANNNAILARQAAGQLIVARLPTLRIRIVH